MTDSSVPLQLRANLKRVRATCMGWVIADTNHAITLFEDGRAPVHYFPPDDVELDQMVASGQRCQCAVKGEAAFYGINVNGQTIDEAAWVYEAPTPAILALKHYVAFDPAKVEVAELGAGEAVFPAGKPAAESWDLAG